MTNPQTDTDLSHCPFCGKSHTLKVIHSSELHTEDDESEFWPHSDSWAVMCDAERPGGPGGCGGMGGFFPTQAEAIAAWNRRPATAPEADIVTVDGVAWDAFIADYNRYIDGQVSMPFSRLRESLAAVVHSAAQPPSGGTTALQQLADSQVATPPGIEDLIQENLPSLLLDLDGGTTAPDAPTSATPKG